MKIRTSLAAVLLFTALYASPGLSQQDFSDVEVSATHVAGSVWMLMGAGGNIGVSSGPDGVLMVDDQFAPLADKIRQALVGVGESADAATPRFVINTHYHGDHTGGNEEFGAASTIVAHTNVRTRLISGGTSAVGLPIVTFDESLSIHFNGEEIRAFHIPSGHTDGDALIYFTDSNVLHMGDDFFQGRFPYVDLAAGGSVRGLIAGIEQVINYMPDDVRIIPGHGPLSNLDDLSTYVRMIRENLAMVEEKMENGLSLEEIQSEGVAEEWSGWGAGFISTDRWLETLYNELSDSSSGDAVEHGHVHRQ